MDADRIRAWKAVLARDRSSLVFISLVDALRRMRRFDEAHRYAIDGLERHPHLPAAHDALARVLADLGDDTQARDEWDFALRLDPSHQPSLRGLGFLAYKRRDLAAAEQYLARALQATPADDGLASALRRVRSELRVSSAAEPAPAPKTIANRRLSSAKEARQLFAALLGDGDRTALLLDRDGLVLAGTYVDGTGREVADEVGAHLSGLADEASRALKHLGLGRWESLLVESQHATVALAPGVEGAVVLVAAARDTQVGLVRRLLSQARQKAAAWMERAA
jgi:predicted regulator of Ras-like GTPase activity (Roadblock/LC7/MglB family)/Tfp pilus assembly protein PilF